MKHVLNIYYRQGTIWKYRNDSHDAKGAQSSRINGQIQFNCHTLPRQRTWGADTQVQQEGEKTQNITVHIFNPVHRAGVEGPPLSYFPLKATDNLKCFLLKKW